MAEIVIKGMDKLQKMIDIHYRMLEEYTKQAMADMMLNIQRNTNKGLNADNVPFISYANSTVKHKIKVGKSTTPNMQETSSMMNSLNFIPARKSKTFIIYKIGVKGSYKGVSNKVKLKKLSEHKNYYILRWTPFYKKLVNTHFERFVKRYINKVT